MNEQDSWQIEYSITFTNKCFANKHTLNDFYFRVQQAYCLQQIGREKEAATIYQNVLKDKPSDQALVAIASNNLVVINR